MNEALLLMAYGGPGRMEDVRPFVEDISRGHPVSQERINSVVARYQSIGGISPVNDATMEQAQRVESLLKKKKKQVKVYVGMLHWSPHIPETMEEMRRDKIKRAMGIVLAPHRCEASWDRYKNVVTRGEGRPQEKRMDGPLFNFCEPWHDHPLFIEAVCGRIQEINPPCAEDKNCAWIFTAHSIPVSMDEKSGYSKQVFETAGLVSKKLRRTNWSVAYQSRSGFPQDSWTGPDVKEKIKEAASMGAKSILLIPIGFVCDNAEVLYDLDIEAKMAAEGCGVKYIRAKTVSNHPKFIELLADLKGERSVPGRGSI